MASDVCRSKSWNKFDLYKQYLDYFFKLEMDVSDNFKKIRYLEFLTFNFGHCLISSSFMSRSLCLDLLNVFTSSLEDGLTSKFLDHGHHSYRDIPFSVEETDGFVDISRGRTRTGRNDGRNGGGEHAEPDDCELLRMIMRRCCRKTKGLCQSILTASRRTLHRCMERISRIYHKTFFGTDLNETRTPIDEEEEDEL
ncbi:hypothetical protein GDO81_014664 [Engystomops pustulosus]|uniref:Uncharacterized protein n=1 Tax=Engystomops pustulosus TaxID=76066 RepID=A0AAV7BC31_ENGPU|nr:hypothetical protein GDO81_014664 [Engystomops pustulosus]